MLVTPALPPVPNKETPAMLEKVLVLILAGTAGFAPIAAADHWSSPKLDLVYVQVERPTLPDAGDGLLPLPRQIEGFFGADLEEYDAFVAGWVAADRIEALRASLAAAGLLHFERLDHEVPLPWRRQDLRQIDGGSRAPVIASRAVPGLFVVTFAYPIREEWVEQLRACEGTQLVAYLGEGSFLVRSGSPGAARDCASEHRLLAVRELFNDDRLAPAIAEADELVASYLFQFAPGTDLAAKAEALGLLADDVEEATEELGLPVLRARTDRQRVLELVESDHDLVSVTLAGEAVVSGEREGQIVAGQHNGGQVTTPGYYSWLTNRGLNTLSNQQIVAIHDIGYDDGTHPGVHHPDLEGPDRLVGLAAASGPTDVREDTSGHGTLVAGIIAGDGLATNLGSGAVDSQGFHRGSGIAPRSSLYAVAFHNNLLSWLNYQGNAITATATSSGASIINHSWNEVAGSGGALAEPVPTYSGLTKLLDERVIDAIPDGPAQPMNMIFSAGNFGYSGDGLNPNRWDSVSSPATGKNVIAVGATHSYLPSNQSGAPPLTCVTTLSRAPAHEQASHVAKVANFSSRGKQFGLPQPPPLPEIPPIHSVRVKPDLVAPGHRIHSTTPHTFSGYGSTGTGSGCQLYWPQSPITYHTYGSGTSFSAPVVSGVVALGRKWFLDRGTNPLPSLVKAALVATADDLGGLQGNDHRPSPLQGWGRVSLDRLTDPTIKRFWINESVALSTGQQASWTKKIANAMKPAYVVLVWSDPASDVWGDSQVALKNNLQLKVDGYGSYRGNNFHENIGSVDNGYSFRFTFSPFANDQINTVEAIFIPPGEVPAGTNLTIGVVGTSVPFGPQKFSVYAYNME